jgi:hypothetical protein
MTSKLDVRVTVELPNGKREHFGYAFPVHHLDGRTFAPLPRDLEIDPMALHEAMAQRDRRNRIAEVIGRTLAEAILEAAERNDPVRGYSRRELQRSEDNVE